MKRLGFLTLLLCSTCFAKEFHFTYNLQVGNKVQTVKYKTEAESWKEAHSRGANFCMNFFADKYPPRSEEDSERIADTCTNPSEK